MEKIVIFTEGLCELVFIRHLLFQIFGYEEISLECMLLRADKLSQSTFKYCSPNAKMFYLIINVGNDEKVLSVIIERQENLIKHGYHRIIGLRDMYSQSYSKQASYIDNKLNESFIIQHKAIIQNLNNSEKIKIFFAIMELEAWVLSMFNLFTKIHSSLTNSYIKEKLGYDLININPETKFYRPSIVLKNILNLAQIKYTKSLAQMESIFSHINKTDINDITNNGRCNSFNSFISEFVK